MRSRASTTAGSRFKPVALVVVGTSLVPSYFFTMLVSVTPMLDLAAKCLNFSWVSDGSSRFVGCMCHSLWCYLEYNMG